MNDAGHDNAVSPENPAPSGTDDAERDAEGNGFTRPALFLIFALLAIHLLLSVVLPEGKETQRRNLANLSIHHLERIGRLGLVFLPGGEPRPVVYVDSDVEAPAEVEVVLPSKNNLIAGVLTAETGSDEKGRTYRELRMSPNVRQHRVFSTPRDFVGEPVYCEVGEIHDADRPASGEPAPADIPDSPAGEG